jgi:hypothetical protein
MITGDFQYAYKYVELWLKECLLPVLPSGEVVILDNASLHRRP